MLQSKFVLTLIKLWCGNLFQDAAEFLYGLWKTVFVKGGGRGTADNLFTHYFINARLLLGQKILNCEMIYRTSICLYKVNDRTIRITREVYPKLTI